MITGPERPGGRGHGIHESGESQFMVDQSPSVAAPQPPSRGLFGPLVRWLLASVLIAVIGGILCLPSLLSTPERVSQLIATTVPELRGDVKLARVGVGWLGPIVLDDVKIVPRNGEPTPVTIRRIEVSNGLAGILLSLGDLGRVRIEGLQADLVFDREHRSNLDAILPPDGPQPATDMADGVASGRPRRAAVRLHMEVDDAIVRITGPWTTDSWVSDPIDVRARLANAADGLGEWTVEPVQLLTHAELRQAVAHEVLAYIVPVLADSARTSGRFSLRLDGARLPVGRPEAAELSGLLAMHEVVLGPGPLVENMFQSLPMKLPPPPTIRVADESNINFRLADRRMWHKGLEFGIPLQKPGQRLDVQSEGSVGLEDRSLDIKLTLPIPTDLPQDRPLVAALAGKQISLGVGGELGKPEVKFDGSIKAAAGQVLVDLIDRLRDGPRPERVAPPPQTPAGPPQPQWTPPGASPPTNADSSRTAAKSIDAAAAAAPPKDGSPPMADSSDPKPSAADAVAADQPPATPREKAQQAAGEAARKAGADPDTAEAIVDIVGGVLGEVAKRRAERRAAEAANPALAPPPSRRGRLLDRILQPPPARVETVPAQPPAIPAIPASPADRP
ncbi:MAG: hypothetical protein ACR2IT_00595 [Pirellulales bacterium]